MKDGAKIGELARAVAVSVQTVRYYERRGLLPRVPRSSAGYRLFASHSLDRLRFIRRAQAVGLRLEEIREILRIHDSGKAPCECVRGMLEKKLEEIEHQLRELASFRRRLQRTLKESRKLPRLSHAASNICPAIEAAGAGRPSQKKR